LRYVYHQALHAVFGHGRPGFFHLGNILLKTAVALACFILLRKIFGFYFGREGVFLPFFGALLYSLHPMTVEATAWCIGVKELLSALFYFLALYFFIFFLESGRKRHFALVFVFFLFSILSKVSAVSFPFVAAVFYYYARSELKFRKIAALASPFLAVIAVVVAFNIAAYSKSRVIGDIEAEARMRNVGSIIETAVPVYLLNLSVPLFNSPVYDTHRFRSPADARFIFSILVIFAVVAGAGFLLVKRKNAGIFAAFFVLGAFPAFLMQTYILAADRYMFIPVFSAASLIALAVFEIGRRRQLRFLPFFLCSLLAIFYYAATVAYSFNFQSDKKLFTRAMKIAPRNPIGFNNYGAALRREGKPEEAIPYFKKAAALDPKHYRSRRALGGIYFELGSFKEAAEHYMDSFMIYPTSGDINLKLGKAHEHMNDFDAALHYYTQAAIINSSLVEAFSGRGIILYQRKEFEGAESDFRRVIELNPESAFGYVNLGSIEAQVKKNYPAARELFLKADRLEPGKASTIFNVALTYDRERNFREAKKYFLLTWKLDPPEPMKRLIVVHMKRIDKELKE
jgi:tetratricopeptide (TPR) repeat protein